MATLTSQKVWHALEKESFAVLGMVSANHEARTAGIVYVVRDGKLYISSRKEAWKVRHIRQNRHVSLTVPIAKRIPLMPWIKIPAATITFAGEAVVREFEEVNDSILQSLMRGLHTDPDVRQTTCVIEVTPVKDFVTYGVGVSLMTMRDPQQARGRAPVKTADADK